MTRQDKFGQVSRIRRKYCADFAHFAKTRKVKYDVFRIKRSAVCAFHTLRRYRRLHKTFGEHTVAKD